MSYSDIEQVPAWSAFFNQADPSQYSIVIHRVDGKESSFLPNSVIIPTIPSKWGDYSLAEIELLLYAKGAEDTANKIFVLLSGDSIPLCSFRQAYDYLIKTCGILELCGDNDRSMWRSTNVKHALLPNPSAYKFNKAAIWKVLTISTVRHILEYRDCLKSVFGSVECPDEHGIPTLLHNLELLNTIDCNKTYMHVDWCSRSIRCRETHRPEPKTLHRHELTKEYLDAARNKGCIFLRKVCKTHIFEPHELYWNAA